MKDPNRQRQLIINGDDFGISSEVNHAIIDAHQRGVLTSTSLMVTGDAFEEAVALAKANPDLAVGLHLVLVCGRSVLPPEQIPHLVNAQGYFSYEPEKTGLRYHLSTGAKREIPLEIRAQLEKFCQTGLPLSHVDGHLHVHTYPAVLPHLADLAQEFHIRFIRLPLEEAGLTLNIDRSNWFMKYLRALVFGGLRRYGEGVCRSHGIQFTDRVYGELQSGRLTERYLLGLLPQIQASCVEIFCHPELVPAGEFSQGNHRGLAERDALVSDRVRQVIEESGFHLTNYLKLSTR